jgi:hypothetical protein
MSLGTPVADGPPPVDAPFPSRPTWPEVQTNLRSQRCSFPQPLPSRDGKGRQPPVQTAGRPSDGAGATVIRPARGPVNGATTHVTGPGLAGERPPGPGLSPAPHAVHRDLRRQRSWIDR